MNTILPDIKIADKDIEFFICEIKARIQKKRIINYFLKSKNKQLKQIAEYLKNNSISVFPYEYRREYQVKDVCVQKDVESGLLFVKTTGGGYMFFRRGYKSKYRVARYYNNILIEQDSRSPHCYTSDTFYPNKDCIILDVGGAEGYFSMQYIQSAKKIFIFECNPEWINALKKTYEKYKDKVFIIDKFVADYSDDSHITLDDFIHDYHLASEKIFVKIDAEGSESLILRGAVATLQSKQEMQIAICTYHSQRHEEMFRKIFKGWKIEMSEGYMLYYYDYNFQEPYARHGVLRAEKSL